MGEPRHDRRGEAQEGVGDCQDPDPGSGRKLVMNKVHDPSFIGPDRWTTVIPELGLHPPLRYLVPELKAQLFVKAVDIRDFILEAVERRFGTYRAPVVIEMLSDNGSPYIARDTQIFACQLGLKTKCPFPDEAAGDGNAQ